MIIDEMGFFWWDNLVESPTVVPGHLSIDDHGKVKLEMHGSLGGDKEYDALFGQIPFEDLRIRGELKKSGKKILLTDLIANGANVGRFSYVHYSALYCYVSQSEIEQERFNGLYFPLTGLEGWFQPGNVNFSRNDSASISFLMELTPGEKWMMDEGELSLVTDFVGKIPNHSTHHIDVGMKARLEYTHSEVTSAAHLLKWFEDTSDFISLLTNSSYVPRRPFFTWKVGDVTQSAECHFFKSHSVEENLSWHNVRLPLKRIKKDFGLLLQKWFNKKRSLGPGVNLYLGAIKNHHLYAENRFVNMIWGLESLDRRNVSATGTITSEKLNKKSNRVFSAINGGGFLKSKDKRWVLNLLSRTQEPSLAERLFDVLSNISDDLKIDPLLLRQFCKECADLRNDMSHHGGERTPGEYDTFISKLFPRMNVLERLYPLVIFNLIGVDKSELSWMMHKNHNSFELKEHLKQVGLLPIGPASTEI